MGFIKKNIIIIITVLLVPLMFFYGYLRPTLFKNVEYEEGTAKVELKELFTERPFYKKIPILSIFNNIKTDDRLGVKKPGSKITRAYSEEYWDNWNKEDKMARFVVNSVNIFDRTFEGYLEHPTNHSLYNMTKVYPFSCVSYESVIYFLSKTKPKSADELKNISREDYISLLTPSSVIYTHCIDDSCDILGDSCIIEIPLE